MYKAKQQERKLAWWHWTYEAILMYDWTNLNIIECYCSEVVSNAWWIDVYGLTVHRITKATVSSPTPSVVRPTHLELFVFWNNSDTVILDLLNLIFIYSYVVWIIIWLIDQWLCLQSLCHSLSCNWILVWYCALRTRATLSCCLRLKCITYPSTYLEFHP